MAAIGIPSYRLPKDVLRNETGILTSLGARMRYGEELGRDYTIDDLFARGYRAGVPRARLPAGLAPGG